MGNKLYRLIDTFVSKMKHVKDTFGLSGQYTLK